ncbi:MAG TPA: aryl-sulfate sulfotransferase, partial [Chloroflexota bacterium]|nr:aryl-sulfate sulfotransferase [Chloroflexota bacterium]
VRDFDRASSFTWTPLHEGSYRIQATVKDGFTATAATSAMTTFAITSRAFGNHAVVNPTANPLVALYSVPACATGTVVVQFRPATGSTAWQSMAAQPCSTGQSVNVLVAGMRPNTRYVLQHVLSSGKTSTTSPQITFTTGKVPAGLKIASFTVPLAPTAKAYVKSPLTFHALNPSPSPALANPVATDLSGHLVWYYDTLHSGLAEIWPVHIVPGGTALLFGRNRSHATGDNVFREVDLAGDTVRETNIDAVSAQLARRGQEPIYEFHHDALRLPDGDTAVLGATQKKVNGHDVMSDMVVVLDTGFQVVWNWDMFDHFSPPATFPVGTPTCVIVGPALCGLPDPKSIDWTHGNGLAWSAQDGNLIVSFRNTALVIKIAYQNGHGTGKVLWRLGKGGDFSINSSDPYPWFSQQHNANYVNATDMVIYDDGNTRCQNGKVKGCHSRGQEYRVDEQHHTATLLLNADLGAFWQALGSAQGLPNGDATFAGGFAGPGYKGPSKEEEFSPHGTKVYEQDTPLPVYRAYRLTALS